MNITKHEIGLINNAVLDYFGGWAHRAGKKEAVEMLLEMNKRNQTPVLCVQDLELVLVCLKAYTGNTNELVDRIEGVLNDVRSDQQVRVQTSDVDGPALREA